MNQYNFPTVNKIFNTLLFSLLFHLTFGQDNQEDRDLVFDSTDLKIIQRANFLFSDKSTWNKDDDRECEDDIAEGKYSLFCALFKASIDVSGEYIHRRPAIQIVRFTLEKYGIDRVEHHRLKDWNNHPETTFREVKKVLQQSTKEVKKQLK
jgi:hypothetical protein